MWILLGQDRLLRFLEQSIARGALAHAYLLVGPPHVGKGTLALDLARVLNCDGSRETSQGIPCGECQQCSRIALGRHADISVLSVMEAEGRKEIRLEQVKEALHLANLQPFEGRSRVFIVDGAEQLNEEAANALLKGLEEPPPQVMWALLTTDEGSLSLTIRSRCQRLELSRLPVDQIAQALVARWGCDPQKAMTLARLSGGCLGWAVNALTDPSILETRSRVLERLATLSSATLEERFHYAGELASLVPRQRSVVRETLGLWASWWRDLLMLQQGLPGAIWNQDEIVALSEEARKYTTAQVSTAIAKVMETQRLLDLNVNPRLALENLMLALPKAQRLTSRVPIASQGQR